MCPLQTPTVSLLYEIPEPTWFLSTGLKSVLGIYVANHVCTGNANDCIWSGPKTASLHTSQEGRLHTGYSLRIWHLKSKRSKNSKEP